MKLQCLFIAAVAIALATSAQAQVKVGANPGTLSTNAVLDVEGTSGTHAVMLQNGNFGIGTAAPGVKLQVEGAESQFTNGTSKWALAPTAGSPNVFGIIDRVNNVRRIVFNTNGDVFMGGSVINDAGGSAAMTILGSTGQVGIGTTPASTWKATIATEAPATNGLYVGLNGASAAYSMKLEHNGSNLLVRPATAGGNTTVIENNAGSLALNPLGTYVGVGTTAPLSRFSLVSDGGGNGAADDMEISSFGASVSPGILFKTAAGTAASPANLVNGSALGSLIFQGRYNGTNGFLCSIGSSYVGNGTTALSNMVFTASAVERMRIDENGYVGIGTATPNSRLTVVGNGANNFALNVVNPTGGGIISNVQSGQYAIDILNNGTEVGRVTANASSTTYGTTSDVRLKENIKATHYSLADLMKIQVKDYTYKTDPKKEAQTGFLAQQLYTVFPNAVSVGGEDAAKKPWNVDYGKVTPLLVKAVQELNAKVEALERENSNLKAQANDVASLRSELDAIKALVLKGSPPQKVNSVTKR